ncbi:MAG: methionine adenosyltransferase domain-containing protein [Akkermansiaceae bacterium]
MIRTSEAVLRGHPDKFCDQIADRILYHAYKRDPEAYGQIEVAVWSDQVFLTGATVTREPLETVFADVVRTVGQELGYTPGNSIDANRYQVHDHICRQVRDPREWTRHINDQSIVIGWAGYDAATRFLRPEHFLAHTLRETLDAACVHDQPLEGHGPDGKIIVRIDETPALRGKSAVWHIPTVLVTLQQKPGLPFIEFQRAVAAVVLEALRSVADADSRWRLEPGSTRLLVNPNGPFHDGGSNSDNGQTGRKLVMDYYGPSIQLGGGALSGKDLTHIDRAGSYAARRACLEAVQNGAKEALLRLTYAPGIAAPLDVSWSFADGGRPPEGLDFSFRSLLETSRGQWRCLRDSGRGSHFFDPLLPWNSPGPDRTC